MNTQCFRTLSIIAAACACLAAQASDTTAVVPSTPSNDVATDVHVGYDYVNKVLASARKECRAVQSTSKVANGSVLVDCLAKNSKNTIQYRITPKNAGLPLIEFMSRTQIKPGAGKTADVAPSARDATVNKYALAIIRDYRYECAQVVTVTTQEDNSLVAVCTSGYGRTTISYRLVETPGANMNTRVTPIS